MDYQFIRKKSYWLYSPKEAVRQLYYEATILRQESVKIEISKSEYRKFMRYEKISDNLKRILFYFYCHKIKKMPKMNSSKGTKFRIFGDVDSYQIESKSLDNFSIAERIELILDRIKLEGTKPKAQVVRFVALPTAYGIFWISLKKTGYDRLKMFSFRDSHIKIIKQEVEDLIKEQILKREQEISRY